MTSHAWLRAALLVALIVLVSSIGHGIVGDLRAMASAEAQTAISLTVAIALLVYIVLMALPFCPGIEIGLALLALGGREIAPLVYLATVVALVLAFVVGRFFPRARWSNRSLACGCGAPPRPCGRLPRSTASAGCSFCLATAVRGSCAFWSATAISRWRSP